MWGKNTKPKELSKEQSEFEKRNRYLQLIHARLNDICKLVSDGFEAKWTLCHGIWSDHALFLIRHKQSSFKTDFRIHLQELHLPDGHIKKFYIEPTEKTILENIKLMQYGSGSGTAEVIPGIQSNVSFFESPEYLEALKKAQTELDQRLATATDELIARLTIDLYQKRQAVILAEKALDAELSKI